MSNFIAYSLTHSLYVHVYRTLLSTVSGFRNNFLVHNLLCCVMNNLVFINSVWTSLYELASELWMPESKEAGRHGTAEILMSMLTFSIKKRYIGMPRPNSCIILQHILCINVESFFLAISFDAEQLLIFSFFFC